MARVTSKRQVTIPKAIADRFGIEVGDDLEFLVGGDGLRVRRRGADEASAGESDRARRLERFDMATARQQARQGTPRGRAQGSRGWRRDELYERGRAR